MKSTFLVNILKTKEGLPLSCFAEHSVCIVGLSKVGTQNPINSVYQTLAGSFVVDPVSGLIYDAQFSTICKITSDFLASQVIGLSFFDDLDEMISRIQNRYFGNSRRAIVAILRDVAARLRESLPDIAEPEN